MKDKIIKAINSIIIETWKGTIFIATHIYNYFGFWYSLGLLSIISGAALITFLITTYWVLIPIMGAIAFLHYGILYLYYSNKRAKENKLRKDNEKESNHQD